MDGFEFVFTLFGLLLGLSLAEVIAGFGRAVEAKVRRPSSGGDGAARPRIGWLSPLLGLLVAFNLVSFWTAAWAVRDAIPVSYLPMLLGLFVTGGYYFGAAMVFPRDIDGHADLDAHYFQVKRWTVTVVVACNLMGAAGLALAGADPLGPPATAALNLFFYLVLVALIFARSRLANLVLLTVAAGAYPATSIGMMLAD